MIPLLHVILPVHNRIKVTKDFIANLKKQTFQNFHLILVDDGSADNTSEYVAEALPNSTIIKGNGNLWWAGSLQKGFDWIKKNASKTDLVLIINDDTYFEADYLATAVKQLPKDSKTLLFSKCMGLQKKQVEDSGVVWDWQTYGLRLAKFDEEINCCSTRGLFMTVASFLEIGGFHPILLPHYLSDYEFGMRASRKGFNIITHPNVVVWTDEAPAGIREPSYQSLSKFIETYFSPRNYNQPIYVFFFIFFACPLNSLKFRHWRVLFIESKNHFKLVLKNYRWARFFARIFNPKKRVFALVLFLSLILLFNDHLLKWIGCFNC